MHLSPTSSLFIGVDGGGTHTRAAIVDATGTLLGTGTAGPSNFQTVGIDMARENVRRAVAAARARLPERGIAEGAFLGMAGVASERDADEIMTMARSLALAERIGVDHDIRTALAGGLAGEPGIALIAGTGSACYGRNARGDSWRSGGWGPLLDDLGSGYWIGLQGMIAITRAADGRADHGLLTAPLMRALGIERIDDILRLAGSEPLSRAEIAALAPIVLDAARAGDLTAILILEYGARELALMAHAVATRLGLSGGVRIVTIGGLTADPSYLSRINETLEEVIPGACPSMPELPPVLGAALLAMELAGIGADREMVARMAMKYSNQ